MSYKATSFSTMCISFPAPDSLKGLTFFLRRASFLPSSSPSPPLPLPSSYPWRNSPALLPSRTPFPTNLLAVPQSSERIFAENVFLEKFSNPVAPSVSSCHCQSLLTSLASGDRKYSSPLYSKAKRILASVGKTNVSTAPHRPHPTLVMLSSKLGASF